MIRNQIKQVHKMKQKLMIIDFLALLVASANIVIAYLENVQNFSN